MQQHSRLATEGRQVATARGPLLPPGLRAPAGGVPGPGGHHAASCEHKAQEPWTAAGRRRLCSSPPRAPSAHHTAHAAATAALGQLTTLVCLVLLLCSSQLLLELLQGPGEPR